MTPDKLIGPPQATETYTVAMLENMDLIGIYAKPECESDVE